MLCRIKLIFGIGSANVFKRGFYPQYCQFVPIDMHIEVIRKIQKAFWDDVEEAHYYLQNVHTYYISIAPLQVLTTPNANYLKYNHVYFMCAIKPRLRQRSSCCNKWSKSKTASSLQFDSKKSKTNWNSLKISLRFKTNFKISLFCHNNEQQFHWKTFNVLLAKQQTALINTK